MRTRRVLRYVTREGCLLCEKGVQVVTEAARWAGLVVETVDVDSDRELFELYDSRIPVVLDGSGRIILEGRIRAFDAARAVFKVWLRCG